MFDLHNNADVKVAFNPAALTADATTNGNSIDRQFYEAVEFVFVTGTVTDGSFAITIQESSDNSSWSAVAAADLLGSNPSFDSADDNAAFKVGYVGSKRYVRAQVTVSGSTTGVDAFTGIAILGRHIHRGSNAA